jgi:hypothetical protein
MPKTLATILLSQKTGTESSVRRSCPKKSANQELRVQSWHHRRQELRRIAMPVEISTEIKTWPIDKLAFHNEFIGLMEEEERVVQQQAAPRNCCRAAQKEFSQ